VKLPSVNTARRRLAAYRIRSRPWLELLRLPNLLTVPGDPLAGAFLAAAVTGVSPQGLSLACAVLASLSLYAFGLLLNDLVDLPVDCVERPGRPLPRRAVRPAAVATAGTGLALAGCLFAALAGRAVFGGALLLTGLVLGYSLVLKRDRRQACVAMGLCRGVSFALGAAVVAPPGPVLFTAVALSAYIGVVTWLASFEASHRQSGREALAPGILLGAGFLAAALTAVFGNGSLPGFLSCVVALLAAGTATALALELGLRLNGRVAPPEEQQQAIGMWIRLLLPWQAGLIAISGGGWSLRLAVVMVLFYPAHRILSRHFPPS
jgi:4-hydroxybenzoate polyprenyltransferase